MSSTPDLFEQLIDRVEKAINANPVSPYEAIESKQLAPNLFLELYVKKELILLHRFSATRISGALKLIMKVTDGILKKNKTWPFNVVNRLCIYYTLAASCCNSRPVTPTEEVAEESLGRQIIDQSSVIFGNEFEEYTNFVHHTFSTFLAAIGSHSSLIFTYFLNTLQSEIMANTSLKNLAITLKPWTHMPASVDRISNFLKPIASNISLVTDKYREPFCEMLTSAGLMSLKRNPLAFYEFLSNRTDVMIASSISEQIGSWNDKISPFAWPAQFILSIFQPNSVLSTDDQGKGSLIYKIKDFAQMKNPTQQYAVNAALVLFDAFVASNGHPMLRAFVQKLFPSFFEFFLNENPSFSSPEYTEMAYVSFSIASLLMEPQLFTDKIVPFLLNGNDFTRGMYMAKLIKKYNKLISHFSHVPVVFLERLIKPCVQLLQQPQNDSKTSGYLRHIVHAFNANPQFMRMIVFANPDIVPVLFKYVKSFPEVSQQYSYANFFSPKYAEETPCSIPIVNVYNQFLSFLTNFYKDITLYKSTPFGDYVPTIINQIAESMVSLLQTYFIEDYSLAKAIESTLTYLEMSAIMFLASSKSQIRQIGVTVMSSLPEIIHSSPVFSSFSFPIDEYQLLVSECRREKNLKTASSSIKNALKVISDPTKGINAAFDAIFPYFMSLSKALNPNITLVKPPQNNVNFPISFVTEEWIGAVSLLFSIVFDQAMPLFNQLKIFIADSGDIGAYTITAVPTAVAQKHLNALLTLMLGWVAHLQIHDGFFDSTDSNNVFMNNIMKIIRGLTEQRQFWTPQMINITIFGQVARKIVSYCDIVQGESFKIMGMQLLISMISLTNEKGKLFDPMVRHTIGKAILTWLPTTETFSRQYTSLLHKALALLLDDLSLMDCIDSKDTKSPYDQAEAQFMYYFATIKNRLDKEETAASDMIPVLAALLKQNLSIGIGHCASMGFADKNAVRTAFIGAVAAVFKIPETKVVASEEFSEEKSLIDLIYENGFDLIELISGLVPYSRSDVFGAAIVEAAIIKKLEYGFLERMINVEILTTDDNSKNTLFRGNAVPARSVGHFPRVVGTKWMTATLRPLFEEVIEKCEKGVGYIIDPSKIGQGEDIQKNNAVFREYFNRVIETIFNARLNMPKSLIKEAQLIYRLVYEKHGDFANQILSGFLFLRFLLPAFTVPKMVGLPPLLPDNPRAALLQTSTVMMSSILKGQLDDKGAHLIPFNDLAKKAHDLFNQMFREMVTFNVDEIKEVYDLDEKQITKVLHAELYPLIPTITSRLSSIEEGSPLRESIDRLITRVKQIGQPTTSGKSPASVPKPEGEDATEYDELMNCHFADDQIQQMSEAIYKAQGNTVDGSGIVFMHCDRMQSVKDPRVVAQILFKTIQSDMSSPVYVVVVLSGFDSTRIPTPAMLKKYAGMTPALRIRQYILLEPSFEFAQFVSANPQLFERQNRFSVATDVSKLKELLGSSVSLPVSSLESMTPPQSVHRVVINGNPAQARLHEHSIQLCHESAEIVGQKFTPVRVVMADQIDQFTRSLALKQYPDQFQFTITMKGGEVLSMRVPLNSPLYEATMQLTLRSRTINAAISQVSVDTLTIQWLMLNLAFINMLSQYVTPDVRKAALDLVYAVYVSFSFQHSIDIHKMDVSILPDNLLGYVRKISQDLADNNPTCYNEFLSEFFKAYEYVKPVETRPVVFSYLVPWIELYASSPNSQPQFIEKFVSCYVSLGGIDQVSFSAYVWPSFAKYENCIDLFLRYVFEKSDPRMIDIVTQFGVLQNITVSKIWGVDIFNECIQNKDEKIVFVCQVLSILISSHLFDIEGSASHLIHKLATLRLYFPHSILSKCSSVFTNLIHEMYRISGIGKDFDFYEVSQAFSSCSKHKEFISGTECNMWLSKSMIMAESVSDAVRSIPNTPLVSQLSSVFLQDIESSNLEIKCISMIFASAFESDPDAFALKLVSNFHNCSPQILSASCLGLSLLRMSKTLSSKLFFIGASLAVYSHSASSLDLLCSALRQFGQQCDINTCPITESIDKDVLAYLQTCTALPVGTEPVFTTLVLVASYCGPSTRYLKDIASVKSNEPISKAISVIEDDSLISEMATINYGTNLSNLYASILLILRSDASNSNIKEFAISLIESQPVGLYCFPSVSPKFGNQIFNEVDDIRFTGLLLRHSKGQSTQYSVTPLLLQHFIEMNNIKLSQEQKEYLVFSAIPC